MRSVLLIVAAAWSMLGCKKPKAGYETTSWGMSREQVKEALGPDSHEAHGAILATSQLGHWTATAEYQFNDDELVAVRVVPKLSTQDDMVEAFGPLRQMLTQKMGPPSDTALAWKGKSSQEQLDDWRKKSPRLPIEMCAHFDGKGTDARLALIHRADTAAAVLSIGYLDDTRPDQSLMGKSWESCAVQVGSP